MRPSEPFSAVEAPDLARRKELIIFSKAHNLKIKNYTLFHNAFIHKSANNEQGSRANNERLEFLGDSVIGMLASHLLFTRFAMGSEGDLARIKSVIISEETLSGLALEFQIDRLLVLGKGEEQSGGRYKKAILADAFEALIAAVYLDAGYATVEAVFGPIFLQEIERVAQNKHKKDFKSLLQEYCQAQYRLYPLYKVVKRSGPEHDRLFWVKVLIKDRNWGPVTGHTKKAAEQAVAKLAWEDLHKKK